MTVVEINNCITKKVDVRNRRRATIERKVQSIRAGTTKVLFGVHIYNSGAGFILPDCEDLTSIQDVVEFVDRSIVERIQRRKI